ncbi:type III-B CRISPR module RAMP protein Cmr6 [Thomasclavelia cocleata]|uniref:type III-B CRISPR module RAMP protein Cmr6 n=1 Tax=Thomasclavelia cocleata TaxID=69824 RepID=UPI0024322386|nr:type III-B CRISPR module RAMP protein Cmr6 [Thomasclavelia cocleata]MCI9629894.1 type III-B CRISPR module RAMP protein Cmr6 [Thomasclavelia cocleata]
MSDLNMNYFFNKTYYDFLKNIDSKYIGQEIDEEIKVNGKFIKDIIKENNSVIKEYHYQELSFLQPLQDILSTFEMAVEYPGLLIGIGNNHQANIKGEIALGFNFDYVTGLPYIPGSSLKGKLASVFKYTDYILSKLSINDINDNEKEEFVRKLKTAIFGEDNIPGKDIFIDSFVSDYNNKKILKLDNLAPHHQNEKLLTLGEVNVITMLRLAPGTKIKFNFILTDSIIEVDGEKPHTIKKNDKINLFKETIKDFGIGAKTNVGYGYLVE